MKILAFYCLVFPLVSAFTGCLLVFTPEVNNLGTLVTDNRLPQEALQDTALEITIRNKVQTLPLTLPYRLHVSCFKQHVLILGQVANAEEARVVSRALLGTDGIKKLYNELRIGAPFVSLAAFA